MNSRILVLCVVVCFPLGAQADEPSEMRARVEKALPLLAKGAAGHREQRSCFACHNQGMPILALTLGRSRGFALDETDLQRHVKHIVTFLDKNRAGYLKGKGQGGQVATAGAALWALELAGAKPDETTAAVAEYLLLFEADRDHWRMTSNRPPTEASHFTSSFLALRGLTIYGTAEQQERIAARIEKLRGWLSRTVAKDTEDRVFQLWAMKQAGMDAKSIAAATEELLKTQRGDGGWAQLDKLEPDAYATGSALVALAEAGGLKTDHSAYRAGLAFLVKTQQADGSWQVTSRSKPFQAYFASGFPYEKNQWISIAASSWATSALILALPRK